MRCVRGLWLQVSEEEYEMVNSAAANADRYYRTMATANLHGLDDATQAADAFRLVSQVRGFNTA